MAEHTGLRGPLKAIGDDDPLRVKSILLEKGRQAALWAAFDRGIRRGRLGFVRLYLELLDYVGGERDLVLVFLQQFGMQSVDQLRAVVERDKGLEGYSLEDGERDAVETLKLVLAQYPERANRIRAELFGGLIELAEDAVEPAGNGGPLPGVRVEPPDADRDRG